jgi:hypothetical protein
MLKCEYQIKTNAGMIIFAGSEELASGGNQMIQITNDIH